MKRLLVSALIILFLSGSVLFPDETELLSQVEQLDQQKKYPEALLLLDNGLKEFGATENLLAAKFQTLLAMNRVSEALPVAIRRSEVAARKSPWHCIAIVSICLKLNDLEGAFVWLNQAVERGFLDYSELDSEEFAALKKDPRFGPVVKTIQNKIGIGRPAKDFTVELFSGVKFILSGQKNKVVLIDFWATWCPPCREGIIHLREYYEHLKGQGFEIIGISLDTDRKKVAEYLAKEKLAWKIAFSGQAWNDDIAKLYSTNLIPAYWLIDRRGILRDFGTHLRDKETMKLAIEKLLAEKQNQ